MVNDAIQRTDMKNIFSEEDAIRQFSSALIELLNALRNADRERLMAEIRTIATAAQQSPSTSSDQQLLKPLLMSARQAAKTLSVSTGTLYNLTAPRGPIPSVKLGARVCYATIDLERAIEMLKVKPRPGTSPEG